MINRERAIQFLVTVLALALQVVLTRFGIVPPPVVVPPSTINPPPTIQVTPAVTVPINPPTVVPTIPGRLPGTGTPDTPQTPKVDPFNASVKLIANGHHCTATVIGPMDTDRRQWVLSAAHCVSRIGERQTIQLRNGQSFSVSVVTFSTKPDYAWLRTDELQAELPFTLLSGTAAVKGVDVWHSGYGVHRPGNIERGKVSDPTGANGRVWFDLSVSHGDSGAGIINAATGYVTGIVSVGSGRDPSPWTIGPDASTIGSPISGSSVGSADIPCPICPPPTI